MVERKYSTEQFVNETNQDRVLEYLFDIGFPSEFLREISKHHLEQRILSSAKKFNEIGYNNFNSHELAMVCFAHDWNPESTLDAKRDKVKRILKEKYGSKRARMNDKENLNISNVQLLRMESGNYFGNLEKARKVWNGFSPGTKDWINNIKIPLKIGYEEGKLLATYLSSGQLYRNTNGTNPSHIIINLYGRCNGLGEEVTNLIKKVHNYKSKIKVGDENNQIIVIPSSAVTTWLVDDLKFFNKKGKSLKKNFSPPVKFNGKGERGFVTGLIATKAYYNEHHKYLIFGFSNPGYRKFVSSILKKDGISDFKESGKYNYIALHRGETKRVLEKYEMVNEKHKKVA